MLICKINKIEKMTFYYDYIAINSLKNIYGNFPITLEKEKDLNIIQGLCTAYSPIDTSKATCVNIFHELIIKLSSYGSIIIEEQSNKAFHVDQKDSADASPSGK